MRIESAHAQGLRLLRGAGGLALQAVRLPESTTRIVAAFLPLTRLMAQPAHIGEAEFGRELDRIFAALYQHPLTEQTRRFTTYLRSRNMLPNEGSTENLIRYVVNEAVARSPIPVPQKIVDEFWGFFHELMAEPELRGLADLGLDITRLLLRTYEPLLVEVINELKDIFYTNQQRTDALLRARAGGAPRPADHPPADQGAALHPALPADRCQGLPRPGADRRARWCASSGPSSSRWRRWPRPRPTSCPRRWRAS